MISTLFLFAQKGVEIIAVVKNLMVRAGADFSSARKSMQRFQSDMTNFKGRLEKTMRGIGAVLAGAGLSLGIGSAIKDAMQFESAMQQINRMMGSSAKQFEQWANTQATSFGLARSEAIKYGAVYANLLSGFSRSTAETTQRTEDLLKASAIVASATGRSMDDVMERIRSGLLGETDAIEDLGINANIAMVQTTEAFKKFANGRSWQQLNFQTQQTILYYAILEQAARKYGDTVANNTATKQAMFIAQLKDARLALGQAFLPIYNTILPALTKMAAALATAMRWVAAFTQALFGGGNTQQQTKATNAQASAVSGLGDAYEKAGKKAKGAVASFDQVNLIGGKSEGSGGADVGIGVTPADASLTDGALSGVSKTMDNVTKKAQEMAAKVKAAFGEMKDFIVKNKAVIISALAGLAAGFTTYLVVSNWTSGIGLLTTAFQKLGAAIRLTWAALTGPIGLIAIAVAALVAAFVYLYQTNDKFKKIVDDVWGRIKDHIWEILSIMGGLISAFIYFYSTNDKFRGFVDGILRKIGDVAQWLWQNVMVPFGNWLGDAMVKSWDAMGKAAQWVWENVLVPFGSFLQTLWKTVLSPIADVIGEALAIAFDTLAKIAKDFWQTVLIPLGKDLSEMAKPAVEALTAVLTFLWKQVFVPFGDAIKKTFMPILQFMADSMTTIWHQVMEPIATFVSKTMITAFHDLFEGIRDVIGSIKDIFIGLMNFITGTFSGDWKKAWEGVKTIFKGVMDGLWAVIKTPLNLIIDGINALIEGLNKVKVDVPGWVEDLTGYSSFGFSIPKIPKLAKGGLAYGPTLAMVGDNRGAATDPEVIAPLSKLEGIIGGGSDNREIITMLGRVEKAIKDLKYIQAVISQSSVGQAAVQYINGEARRGRNPIETI